MTRLSRNVRLILSLAATLVGSLTTMTARAADKPVVAVMYFENHTNDKELEVMKKGLADMMITDLIEVDGITVVERSRLEEAFKEMKLQKSPYADKKTAVKMGKVLGAEYLVVGSFQLSKRKLRINARLFDVESSVNIVSSKVIGPDDDIFKLEQELVQKLVAALKKKHRRGTRPRTKVPDVDTLVEYSKGIDLGDKGLYKEAEQAMAKVIRSAPVFALPRMRRQEFIKRLEAAKARRKNIRADRGASLAKEAEDFLKRNKIADLDKERAQHYLAYRALRGRFIINAATKHLSKKGPLLIKTGHKRKAMRLLEAYYANCELLIKEFDRYAKRYETSINGQYHLDTGFELPDEAEEVARVAGIKDSFSGAGEPRVLLAEFLLLGIVWDAKGQKLRLGPTMANLKPKKYRKLGYQLLRKAWRQAHKHAATTRTMESDAVNILELHADALFLHGKHEEGITKLQEILDRYPTSHRFKYIEKRINQHLGLKHNHSLKTRERYAKALQTCNDMDIRVGWTGIMSQRARTMGMAAAPYTVAELEKSCKNRAGIKMRSTWPYIYKSAALFGARHEDCAMFNKYIGMSIQAGGSKSDAAGYRKNYSNCAAP